jgi:hypothetical protein
MSVPDVNVNPDTSSKKMWIAGGAVALLVTAGLLLYFLLPKSSKPKSIPCTTQKDCQNGYICFNKMCVVPGHSAKSQPGSQPNTQPNTQPNKQPNTQPNTQQNTQQNKQPNIIPPPPPSPGGTQTNTQPNPNGLPVKSHCTSNSQCQSGACASVTGDPQQECCPFSAFYYNKNETKVCMGKPCNILNNNTDCPTGSTCNTIYDMNNAVLYQCS